MFKRYIALVAAFVLIFTSFASCDHDSGNSGTVTSDVGNGGIMTEDGGTSNVPDGTTSSSPEQTTKSPTDDTTISDPFTETTIENATTVQPETDTPTDTDPIEPDVPTDTDAPTEPDVPTDPEPPVTAGAPDDAVEYNGHYYKVYAPENPVTWIEAFIETRKLGGYLATVTSDGEQAFVSSLVTGADLASWIGAYLDKDGVMKWITGEAFDYTNWDDGEPSGVIGSNSEMYLGIYANDTATKYSTTGKWNDFANDSATPKAFVCEWNSNDTDPDAFDFKGELLYELTEDSKGYVVKGIGTAFSETLDIPATYRGLPVTEIDKNAFKGFSHIEKIVFGENLTDVGMSAFENNISLETVVMNEKLESMLGNVFRGCTSLKNVTLPSKLETLGANAFVGCASLETINIPKSLSRVNGNLFNGCSNLKKIVFEGTAGGWYSLAKNDSWNAGIPADCALIFAEGGSLPVFPDNTDELPSPPSDVPTFEFTQESVVDNNEYTDSAYNRFNKQADAVYFVPGLNQGFIPQGMDVWEEEGVLLISGYFKDTTYTDGSVIFAVSLEGGWLCGVYSIMKANGTRYTGHAGGIAVTPYNLYISEGSSLHRIPLSSIKAAGYTGNIQIVESIKVPVRASFCNYSDGILWVGDFYYGSTYPTDEYRHMTNRDGKQYCAWSVGYYLADGEDEFTDEKYNEDLPYATPDTVLSIDERIQGFAVVGDHIVLSQSYGRTTNSVICIYDNVTKTETAHTSVTLNGKSVPVWFLDSAALATKYTSLPMSEGLAEYNGVLLILFESGASCYKDDGGKNPTDRVWKFIVN